MVLVHLLKNAKHLIPLDSGDALRPEAFATYTHRSGDGPERPHAFGWVWASQHDKKYKGHRFELLLTPEELDVARRAIETAQDRFARSLGG